MPEHQRAGALGVVVGRHRLEPLHQPVEHLLEEIAQQRLLVRVVAEEGGVADVGALREVADGDGVVAALQGQLDHRSPEPAARPSDAQIGAACGVGLVRHRHDEYSRRRARGASQR
ncbi:MAG: hypothetical protein P8Y02_06040 [Deinococcales bacterium]